MKNFHRWLTGAIISGIIALVGIIVLALGWAPTATSPAGPLGDPPDDELRALIANPPEYDCMASVTQYGLPTVEHEGEMKVVLTYIPNEVGTAEDQRDFSDSVNVSAIPAERDRVLASICSQPEMAGMVGFALATKQMVGDEKLADLNPDLFGQFASTTPKEWTDKVFSGEISYTDATEAMTQLAGLMTIFEVTEETRATEWNYHALDALTTKASVRPIVENPQQYTGDFLVFSLTRKGQTDCWASFGINIGVNGDRSVGDQRIAGFDCEPPPPPPVCKVNCEPPPPPPPGEKKDPSKDPYPRGNAPDGGGPNADPGPGTYVPPGDMEQPPETPRVNPEPPAPSTPPVGSTPDPAPAPDPEPSAPPANDPVSPDEGNGCAPGISSC